MKILVAGATGFIGTHLTDALVRQGHDVRLCVRDPASARRRWPGAEAVAVDFSRVHTVADWLPHLADVDVVINAVGIIRESASQRFKALHTEAPCLLFEACAQAGVGRVIQISALGADAAAFSRYHLSKRAADACLMGLDLDWTIVLPSIVFGPGAKSTAFFSALAALPLTPLVADGEQQVQPIAIDDAVKALLQIVDSAEHNRCRIELVGPEAITLKQLYVQLRDWLGLGRPRFIAIPYPLALLAGSIAGLLGDTPLTRESIRMLQRNNTGDVVPFVKRFGFVPQGFGQALKARRAQQADRWHAGLYFLRPLLRLAIAFVWILTGIVSAFVYPVEQSYALLEQAGITGSMRPVMLYGAAAVNLGLGIATLMAYRLAVVGALQAALIVLYSIIIAAALPEFWLHPFGPVSKNIPLIVATLMMLVLERNRGLRNA